MESNSKDTKAAKPVFAGPSTGFCHDVPLNCNFECLSSSPISLANSQLLSSDMNQLQRLVVAERVL